MTTYVTAFAGSALTPDNASFRRICGEITSMLEGCGLVRIPFEGEINLDTVTRPANSNAVAGKQIWKFNDSLQDESPIFILIEYASSNVGNSSSGFYLTVGASHDGAGSLTAVTSSRFSLNRQAVDRSFASSYACHTDGHLGLIYRVNSSSFGTAVAAFAISRICDSNGNPTPDGIYIIATEQTPAAQALVRATGWIPINTVQSSEIFQFPLGVARLINAEIPMHPIWAPTPSLQPIIGIAAYPRSLITNTDEIEIAMTGGTSRTYLLVNNGFSNGTIGYAMLWE